MATVDRAPAPIIRVDPKPAEPATIEANSRVLKELPFEDRTDYEQARRGFIGTVPDLTITGPDGKLIWTLRGYDFLDEAEAPPTVNPSLWRNAQLNMNNGLFQVAERIYQVRAFDISNMTIIEGETGLIVVDPLISQETAKAALELYYSYRPRRDVKAVIYTHSHVDHYGGVKGIVTQEQYNAGDVRILAPDGFTDAAVSENVFAGTAMTRRATYMYGALLHRNDRQQVDAGLGKTNSVGTVTLIAPDASRNDIIKRSGDKRTVDGVEIRFQMAPDTEAPAEMLFYFPQFRALCIAEDMTHNLHNLYTLRGAQVRHADSWWKAINHALDRYGEKSDVMFASHHWPTWGRDAIIAFMRKQRDLYKFINDQSLRLLNHGYTPIEIAETIELPESLATEWYNRGYYGSMNHNTKAVYQRYLGWYDGNPANLHVLPPTESSKNYVEYMGGSAAIMDRATASFRRGEYRWVAEVMNHVVFAEPHNVPARLLQADALEQLGYQAESGPWRNVYLMGAYELRNGKGNVDQSVSADTIRAMSLDLYFEFLGIRLNAPKAEGKKISINWHFTDTGQKYGTILENSVLMYRPRKLTKADATLTLTRVTLDRITLHELTYQQAVDLGLVQVGGDAAKVVELLGMLDLFVANFDIVTP